MTTNMRFQKTLCIKLNINHKLLMSKDIDSQHEGFYKRGNNNTGARCAGRPKMNRSEGMALDFYLIHLFDKIFQ